MDDTSRRRRRKSSMHRWRRILQWKTYKNVGKLLIEHKQSLFTSLLLLVSVVLLFAVFSQFRVPVANDAPAGAKSVGYSTFVQQVKAGDVVAVTIQGNNINGLLASPSGNVPGTSSSKDKNAYLDYAAWARTISANSPSFTSPGQSTPNNTIYTRAQGGVDPQLMALLISKHVVVTTLPIAQTPGWLAMIWKFLPMIFLVIFFAIFLGARNGSRTSRTIDDRVTQIGKSRARRFTRVKEATAPSQGQNSSKQASSATAGQALKAATPRISTEPPVTFADVAGIEEVRTELEEIVRFLRGPEQFKRLGARIPRGALLVGPPGTGKTLLAKAVAGEAGVPFFSISASEFVEMFVGVGASRVRDLFNQARQVAPAVIFIDEIDAVGRKRAMRMSGNDERDQTLNQLLVELDGFNERQTVVVLAATNRVDILDKALLRPGRFDRRITVSLPDRTGREAILAVHTRKTPLDEGVSLARLARLTTGMSGADLANLVNEAALGAARKNLDKITDACFEDALARIQLGALRPIVMNEHERRIIAYHEGGHALVAHYLPEADRVNRVTILPRGQSLGVTQFTSEEDRYNYSRRMLMARIAVGLGGRVAEELTFGPDHITTGAENDLQVVTDLARRMVTRWGMSERVGVVFTDYQPGEEGMGLNMQRLQPDDVPAYSTSLAMDVDGQLLHNGQPRPLADQSFAFAMPTQRSASSAVMNAVIDAEVQAILKEGREMARVLLKEHNALLVKLAQALMEHEQLDRLQFEELCS